MLINDVHQHVVYSQTTCFGSHTIERAQKERLTIRGKSVVFLQPNFKFLFKCSGKHRYKVSDGEENGTIKYHCENCGKISYVGYDPYRMDNINLLKDCKSFNRFIPFIYLLLNNSTINSEFNFFETHFKGLFHGIKVHPNLCSKKMTDIDFNSNYPMIIHCGMTEYDNPLDIFKFAKRYSGAVILAHLARLDIHVLKEIKNHTNIYIDTSPTYLPFQIISRSTNRFFPSQITNTNDITRLFCNIINEIGSDKILFGSDIPWGSLSESIQLYESLKLPYSQKEQIFKTNFEEIFKS